MKSIGVRELKRGISRYLKEVQTGERLMITDRKRQIAVLAPLEGSPETHNLQRILEKGLVYWTEGRPGQDVRRIHSRKSLSDAVLEDRR